MSRDERAPLLGSVGRKTTVAQLARRLDVSPQDVSKAAHRVLKLPAGSARDAQYKLTAHQCTQIERSLRGDPLELRDADVPEDTPDRPFDADPLLMPPPMVPDTKAATGRLEFDPLDLWIHQDVLEKLEKWDHLRKSAGAVVQRLAAHGRTSVVKGCSGANRGWRRSPLGGNAGMQFYLWWTVHGNRHVNGVDGLRPSDIVVRDIRHHDDHDPLLAGDRGDYLHNPSPPEVDEEIGKPWTAEQLDFVNDEHPVRLVLGQPGSGKTTALWKAIEARDHHRVLYLTWSRELTEYADQHFRAFAPKYVDVDVYDFVTFLAEMCDTDFERRSVAESRAMFREALGKTALGPAELGPWRNCEDALFAEVRAELFGAVVPGESDAVRKGGLIRLTDAAYRRRRRGAIGAKAVAAVLKVAKALRPEVVEGVFPELLAATATLDRFRDGPVREGFALYGRVVVDEAQDLTLLETSVVVEHCHEIARETGWAPWLVLAGDDGQTVRPSGFDWGPVSDLLADRLQPPRKFPLAENLRCPTRVADVVDRASQRYAELGKPLRPTKQRRDAGGRDVDAQIFHVAVPQDDASALLEEFKDLENVAVVCPEPDVPAWVPETLRDVVLTPADAKGLEYQAVCVLDPGRYLMRLGEAEDKVKDAARLEEHMRRTAIDRLRVALSRPTETLVFVDVDADDLTLRLSRGLLGDAARYEPEDLVEHLTDGETTVEERVDRRIEEARALVGERPERAWLRADQAVKLLGDPDLPNGVSDEEIRHRARTTLLATAARLLVDGVPGGITRHEVNKAARSEAAALDLSESERGSGGRATDPRTVGDEQSLIETTVPSCTQAFDELQAWSDAADRRAATPFGLLDATLALGNQGQWLRSALPSVAQTLRGALQEQAASPDTADQYAGDVEGWLRLTGYPGDVAAQARRLRVLAVEALIEHDAEAANRALKKVVPEDTRLVARVREAQGRFDEAAEAFERAEMPEDALRAWRMAGRWEQAIRLAEGTERADLEWLGGLQRMVEEQPTDLGERLTPGERERLQRVVGRVIRQ
ncbi:MAG: hypothetical protein OXK76_16840 [Gammaproteobacteria bacterium]|nr:hypothetical protein [Gammaproteobacteria bacterium]